MTDIRLTAAFGDYDQTRDLANGRVCVKGIDLTVLNYDVEEIFFRFHDRLEWEVSELSMGMYTSAISRGDDRFVAIPAFPSRVFRHSSIYVREDGPVRRLEDLAGKRIGIPQWSQTAGIYVRGWLSETVGIDLTSIKWAQGGVNDPGRQEPSKLRLPDGIGITPVADRSLNDLLCAGEIDAVITARPPSAFTRGYGGLRHLVEDYPAAEAAYYRETNIFPIMHTVAIRRDAYEANRWISRNLFVAFEEAKERSLRRLMDLTAAHVPLPWIMNLAQQAKSLFPEDAGPWPYGLHHNRATIEAFLRFGYQQGVCHRHLSPEELFAEESLADVPV
ncbi:4,5-dihydroxyphthalate decarboxylase [Amorphus sp. MBR-141]